MGRRGRSTSIGKFAKMLHDRRVSEIRVLGEALRGEGRMTGSTNAVEVANAVAASKAEGRMPASSS